MSQLVTTELRMSTADKNSCRKGPANHEHSKLLVPWRVQINVWVFMITLSVSPILYLLGSSKSIAGADWVNAVITVVLIQIALWIVQRRCSSEDLTYWEGLSVAAASMHTGLGPITLILALPMLFLTVAASFLFALMHDGNTPVLHASIRFCRLIIGIHKLRLY
jgi:hypothetical protein